MDCWLCGEEGMRVNRRVRATCRRTEGGTEGAREAGSGRRGGGGRGSSRTAQAVGEGSPAVFPRLPSGRQAGRLSVLHWPHLLKLSLQLLNWTQKCEAQRQRLC